MTDLLTLDEVKKWQIECRWPAEVRLIRICRDYLTLWDELKNERSISDRLLERIAELEKAVATARRGGME